MGIPSCFAQDMKTLHRLVAIESIFNRTCQHVMNTRVSICRGRTFKEYKLWTAFPFFDGAMKNVVLFPFRQYLFVSFLQIQTLMFGKSFTHKYTLLDMCCYLERKGNKKTYH